MNLGARLPLAFVALMCVARPVEARRYTLPELIDRVSASYAGVLAARQGIESAEQQLMQANGLMYPQGQLTFGITGTPDVECVDAMGNPIKDKATREANCLRTNVVDFRSGIEQILPVHGVGLNLGVNFVQPLYTFGKISGARHAAEAGVEVARAQVDKDRAEAILNVTRAYWGLKWSRAAWSTLDDGRQQLKKWVDKIDAALDDPKNRTYTQADLNRMKLALDTAEYAVVDVEKARELALAGLRMLTGDPDADVDDEDLDIVGLAEQPLSFYEDAAIVSRPDARMLAAGLKAARANQSLQRGSMLPDLGIATTLNVGYASSVDDPQNAFMSHPNTVGFGLALVLRYDLAVAGHVAAWKKARADERMLEERRRQALGGIAIEVETAWLDAKSARKKSDLLNHSEKVARGWYNSVDQAMGVGTGNARDLVEAARNYFELRLRHLQSIMDANVAQAQLKLATGRL